MRRILTSIFLVSMLAGCAVEPAREDVSPDEELTQLVDWMSGRFEAPARGGADSVRAPRHMGVIPFRGERDGERWLYVAQWNAEGERPERRLVYRLERGSGNLIFADLFEVSRPDDLPALPGPEMLDALTADDLRRRRGCRIWLSRDEVSFTGGTRGADCASRYRGAARVRIELVIRQNETVEWLQGFDSGGARLWGGDAGARVYRRVRSQVTSDQIPPRSRSEPENETATSVSFAFSIACANNTGGTPLCRAKTLN